MAENIKRLIFTMGGGGFSEEPENLLLDQFFFSLSEKTKPKVCFIPTASGDSLTYIENFLRAMKRHSVEASYLSLFKGPKGSLRDFIFEKDIIYVGGGNTRNLMVLWKEWELDKILKEAYLAGKVLGGISAGSLCWYEQGVTDSIPGELTALNCLGFLKGSNCPHYDGESERRPAFHRLMLAGMKAGVACDNGVAAVYQDEKLIEFVSSRPQARAFLVTQNENNISEVTVQPRYLGK